MMTLRPFAAGLFVSGLLLASPIVAEEDRTSAPTPESARAIMARWVETQQILAKETKDWQQGKDLLQSRLTLAKSEIAVMEEKLKGLRTSGAESDGKRADLSSQEQSLHEASAALAEWVGDLEGQLGRLTRRLPEPVRDKVKPLYDRIPADPARTKVSLAERFQNVVGILNEVSKFNNEITMVTEVRALSDGKPSEVRTVYVGMAQAYYLSAGGEAGVGRPADDGWRWERREGLEPLVRQVVEVLQNKASPRFVPLPVTIQ